jgi:hypothetical protein
VRSRSVRGVERPTHIVWIYHLQTGIYPTFPIHLRKSCWCDYTSIEVMIQWKLSHCPPALRPDSGQKATIPLQYTSSDRSPTLSLAIQGNFTSFFKRLVERIFRAKLEKPACYDAV